MKQKFVFFGKIKELLSEMIKVQGHLNKKVYLACSGGVDSMAVLDFLSRKHDVSLLFFNHDTETSLEAEEFLKEYAEQYKLKLHIGNIQREKLKTESKEEYWRNERYNFFKQFSSDVITCHHLDDCVETWIWSSLHGEGKVIPYRNSNVIRPFRLTRKQKFVDWCINNHVPWVEDMSNHSESYMRNYIRQYLMDECLHVNPGLHKVIAKKIEKEI